MRSCNGEKEAGFREVFSHKSKVHQKLFVLKSFLIRVGVQYKPNQKTKKGVIRLQKKDEQTKWKGKRGQTDGGEGRTEVGVSHLS